MEYLLQCKVLYVEDDETTRDALSYFLKKLVGKLFSAGTYKKAISSFENNRPDIVIVDLLLPDGNGIDLIKNIRKTDKECRVFITTSINETDTVVEAVGLDIEDYVIKPIDGKLLKEKMEESARKYIEHSIKKQDYIPSESTENRLKEDLIKKSFLDTIKKTSGRGGKDVTVSLIGARLEIIVYDALTVFEKTLAGNIRNIASVDQIRTLFYEEIKQSLENSIQEITGHHYALIKIKVDSSKKVDLLQFEIEV